jgi:hypothetical protein
MQTKRTIYNPNVRISAIQLIAGGAAGVDVEANG